MRLPELIIELDRLSASLDRTDAGDQRSLATLIRDRNEVVQELVKDAEIVDDVTREALRRALESGERARQRLMVHRASTREQLGRLYHSGCLLRALSAERREPERIDYRG